MATKKLGQIGTRGLVVHEGDKEEGTYAFFPENAQKSWRAHRVDPGRFAQERGLPTDFLETLVTAGVPVAVFKPDAPVKTFVVNLEAFHRLGDGSGAPSGPIGDNPPVNDDAYLIKEKQNYYAVARGQLEDLDTVNAGEAKILVRRGAVTAGIPNNDKPYGTNCVLVNLTQLLP